MKRKRKTIILGVVVTCVLALSMIVGSAFSGGDTAYTIQATYSNHVPAAFKTPKNAAASVIDLGFDTTTTTSADSSINLKAQFNAIGSDSTQLEVSGTGFIRVGQQNLPFNILKMTRVNQMQLSNGNTFIWGPVDADIKNIKGQDEQLSLGLAFIPETNQTYLTCTIGTLDQGLAAATFGDGGFITAEMKNAIRNNANGGQN
jgi:hypothetical protein